MGSFYKPIIYSETTLWGRGVKDGQTLQSHRAASHPQQNVSPETEQMASTHHSSRLI